MPALVNAMLEVLVEFAILAFVSYFYWSVNGSRPLQRRFILYLHQYLLNRHHKGSETSKLRSSIWKVLFFVQSMPNTPCFLLFIRVVTGSFVSFPFSCHFFSITASSAFIYFWALWSNSATIFGGLLVIEKKKSPGSSPAWKVIKMTWSSASSTCSNSLLKRVTYCLSDSPFD